MSSQERFWTSRLRWRLRGATQWPAFVAATLAEAPIIHLLPPVALDEPTLIEGALIATFGNLFLIGALAPLLTRRLARRAATAGPPALSTAPPAEAEQDVRRDRVATVLLLAGVAGTLAAGLANRPTIVSETEATEDAARAVRLEVLHGSNAELQRNYQAANTIRLGNDLFRICIPRDDRESWICFIVDTTREPARVKRDTSSESNATYLGR